MIDQEKELIDLFRKMDRETRDMYLSHGRIAVIAERAGEKAVLDRLNRPEYASREPVPMGEAVNG
jgi:hypothetical protein